MNGMARHRLIANLDGATGQMMALSIGPTRTEADFYVHIQETIQRDPQASWVFNPNQRELVSVRSAGLPGGPTVWHSGGSRRQGQKRSSGLDARCGPPSL